MQSFARIVLSAAALVIAAPSLAGSSEGWIYWVDSSLNLIQRSRLDGSDVQLLYSGVDGINFPTGIAVDATTDMLYWTMGSGPHKIQRAPADGNGPVATLLSPAFPVDHIKLDVPNGKMYYMKNASPAGAIYRANLADGSQVEELVSLNAISALDLDLSAQKLYWGLTPSFSCVNEAVIQRSDLDGKNVENVVTGLKFITSIYVDPDANQVYWAEHQQCGNQIRRANFDGSGVETILPATYALDLSFDAGADKLHWAQLVAIKRSNPDGQEIEDLVTDGLMNVHGIDVVPAAPGDPADLNGDGVVNGIDLAILLGSWGRCKGTCAADLNRNGIVNGIDLAMLLGAWTP